MVTLCEEEEEEQSDLGSHRVTAGVVGFPRFAQLPAGFSSMGRARRASNRPATTTAGNTPAPSSAAAPHAGAAGTSAKVASGSSGKLAASTSADAGTCSTRISPAVLTPHGRKAATPTLALPSLKALTITQTRPSGASLRNKPQVCQGHELFLHFLKNYVQGQDTAPYFKTYLLSMSARSSYTINVSFDQMCEFSNLGLITATLVSIGYYLLPRFSRTKSFGNEDERRTKTCLSFSGFPVSMEKLEDFLSNGPLVEFVEVSVDKTPILVATVNGRSLIEMLVDAISENHLVNKVSWEGIFSNDDIVIIDYGGGSKHMKILQETVPTSQEAMLKDLRTAAKLFIPLYKINNVLPVYFDEFNEELDGANNVCVGQEWFMESLRYHPALMPSSGRRCFETMLPNIYNKFYSKLHNTNQLATIMKQKPYPDWKIFVKSAQKDGNDVLHRVYIHNNNPRPEMADKYDDTACGLMRFKRNLLEHGGHSQGQQKVQGQCERRIADLELLTAKTFCKYLPKLVRALLEKGVMDKYFREAWELFKASRSDKSDPWSIK
ncbi:hypothetical protein ZWY2020_010464 [Hordeum vulgare]|nr:hypothetical protein ZWY2020_010464 [Hordeum vulgare]